MSQGIQKLTVGVDRGIVDHSIAIVPLSILQGGHQVGEVAQQAQRAVAKAQLQAVAQVQQAVASVVGR
jgi:hypothetical protein